MVWDGPEGLQWLLVFIGEAFYRGGLRDVQLRVRDDLQQQEQCIGCTLHGVLIIELQRYCPHENEAISQTAIASLVHEGIHAYFMKTACSGSSGHLTCFTEDCHGRYIPRVGPEGHGEVWQLLAEAIERVAIELLGLRKPLDLDRRSEMKNHFAGQGCDFVDTTWKKCFFRR